MNSQNQQSCRYGVIHSAKMAGSISYSSPVVESHHHHKHNHHHHHNHHDHRCDIFGGSKYTSGPNISQDVSFTSHLTSFIGHGTKPSGLLRTIAFGAEPPYHTSLSHQSHPPPPPPAGVPQAQQPLSMVPSTPRRSEGQALLRSEQLEMIRNGI